MMEYSNMSPPSGIGMSTRLNLESDFEPQTRARSHTWPCRPEDNSNSNMGNAEGGSPVGSTTGNGMMGAPGSSCLGNGMDPNCGPESIAPSGPPNGVVNGNGNCGIGPGGVMIPKKSSSRRNAWGNMSYADLITQAIASSVDKRLTLSQIYDWMVANVPYFKDKGDSNSSAGWKVSLEYFFFCLLLQ